VPGPLTRSAVTATSLLATVNDAQHTASVVLADTYILSGGVDGGTRQEAVDQLTEHAGELAAPLTR